MKTATNTLLKLLGILLLIAAVLKGWQLLTEPVANNDIWSYRPFLILTFEFELALAIWLLSGLFKEAAWLATLLCFSVFSVITMYKGITGYVSCGCFGSVHVNPWLTLFAIDLPAVIALAIFRPKGQKLFDWPPISRFATTFAIALITLTVTTPVLAFNEPAKITSSYEVLEPETWVGKELPILEHIDIAESLKKGTRLVLLYHYDCPDCAEAIPKYEQIACDLAGNKDFLQIALIEVPPHDTVPSKQTVTSAGLAEIKEWFVTTPTTALITDGKVKKVWEGKAPGFDAIFENIASTTLVSISL